MKILNLCGKTMVSVAVIAAFCDANAAPSGRASMMPDRMPTSPVVSTTVVGNPAVTTMTQPIVPGPSVIPTPGPTPTPDPTPDPDHDPVCPDGGVENSDYTVTMCMDDILQCIDSGALYGGLHGMFNEDVRNSIMNGMKLCQGAIDKCIKDVRVDCRKVYNVSTDVWLDFNSRVVQPEYYNFVLRQTGLTPNQAENTCLLLDRNTYGSSFAAVSDANAVNTEYNQKVGAYNESLNGTLSKDNPQGVAVNTVGYDGNRGHYARWDATKGECLVRVAAYNKDKLITNSWLFGAVGNDNPAEVWEKAGSTFTCSKDLFDMDSLLNDTRTAAVLAVPGGAVLGGAIGAAAGANAYENKANACKDSKYVEKMGNYIKNYMKSGAVFNDYIDDTNFDFDNFGEYECEKINDLYSKVEMYEHAIQYCNDHLEEVEREKVLLLIESEGVLQCDKDTVEDFLRTNKYAKDKLEELEQSADGRFKLVEKVKLYLNTCSFKTLDKILSAGGDDSPLCNKGKECVDDKTINKELARLKSLFRELEKGVDMRINANKGAEIGKGVGIGVATGAAAGGLATAITALVEKSNITCKVGDGLNSVALGKAYTIDSLKDFYVKWNLHLPDTVSPTSAVIDRASWEQACKQFNSRIQDCSKVQINLKDAKGKYTLVPSACKVSGSVCLINDPVSKSHGIK